jgi:hypothetical protein
MGQESGLPPGPDVGLWSLRSGEGLVWANWDVEGEFPGEYWRSAWRLPSVSMLWTLSASAVAITSPDETQQSPFAVVGGRQQDCRLIYCDIDGNPTSDWTGFRSIIA